MRGSSVAPLGDADDRLLVIRLAPLNFLDVAMEVHLYAIQANYEFMSSGLVVLYCIQLRMAQMPNYSKRIR